MMRVYQAEELLTSRSHKKNYMHWMAKVYSVMGLVMPMVKDGRGRRCAAYFDAREAGYKNGMRWKAYPGCICLPKWARTELIILHEIAHHLLDIMDTCNHHHNKLFRDTLIDLVEWHISPNKAAELRWAYNQVYKTEKY